MPEEKKVILCYRRLSMVKEAMDLVSPDRQKVVVNSMVTVMHDYIPEWYEDIEGHSSGRTGEREGWKQLMSQIDRPDVAGLAAHDLSRFYRNVQEFLTLVKQMKERDLILLVAREQVDTTSAAGMAILTILMAMYQLESDLASERMKANIQYKREQMGRHWGPVPFGCMRNEEKNLIPDPKTQGSLLYLYNLFITGNYTYDQLVDMMNDGLHPWYTRQGDIRPWQQHDVRRVLCAWQLYQGHLPLGRQKDNPTQILEGAHDPILPVELCDQVGTELKRRRRRIAQGEREIYLLTPLAYCGCCGGLLDGNTRNDVRYYRHSGTKHGCAQTRTRAEVAETEVLTLLSGLAESETLRQMLYEEMVELREMANPKAAEIQLLIKEQLGQRDRLTDALVAGAITMAEYRPRRDAIDQRLNELQEKLPAESSDEFEEAMWALLDSLRGLPEQGAREQKQFIGELIERIEIADQKITKIVPKAWAKPFF